MSTLSQQKRILIIGGGPAGLLLAQALRKRGIPSTVFEQDSAREARPRDWSFGIYWAQTPLGECLTEELGKEVVEKGQVDERPLSLDDVMPMYNGQTAELMNVVPTPNNIRLHRKNFIRILSQHLDIRYGKKVSYVESDGHTATAYFEDGTSESGDLIIGAEGAHSKVREFLVGKEQAAQSRVPIMASQTMAKLPADTAKLHMDLHPRYTITFHPEGIFTWIGIHDAFKDTQAGDWQFMIIQSWLPKSPYDPSSLTGSAILEDMRARGALYAEPFRSIFQSIPDGTQCWHNQLSYWVTQPWDNRNSTVTLVGDAAHPMTYHRGQGLNNSIHDVATLAKLIAEKGLDVPGDGTDSAVTTYEKELFERGKDAVIGSRENTLAIHDWEMLMQSPLFNAGLSRPDARKAEAEINGTEAKKVEVQAASKGTT